MSQSPQPWSLHADIEHVDWAQAKRDLSADDFDNGRSPAALRLSFANAQHVVFAVADRRTVGMARVLSDGVCNAYLLDVWTHSDHRRQGIGAAMVRTLVAAVPGQHLGWQTDDAVDFYLALGAQRQPEFMSCCPGSGSTTRRTRSDPRQVSGRHHVGLSRATSRSSAAW